MTKPWAKFFQYHVKGKGDPNWNLKYSKWILRPGCLRRCLDHNDDYVEDTVDVDAEGVPPVQEVPVEFP